MRPLHLRLAFLAVMVGGATYALGYDGPGFYTNAQVVAIDVTGRTLVIRDAKGTDEKVQLDDRLAGFGGVEVGDRVVLILQRGPGWARVRSIVRSRTRATPIVAAKPSIGATGYVEAMPASDLAVARVDASPDIVSRQAFAAEVARLARQADDVDRLWTRFQTSCNFTDENLQGGVRGWFVLWEGSTRGDLSGGFCRDIFNQIVDLAEPIKAGMDAAEDVARRTLSPGEMREIRARYIMDWSGVTSPKPLER